LRSSTTCCTRQTSSPSPTRSFAFCNHPARPSPCSSFRPRLRRGACLLLVLRAAPFARWLSVSSSSRQVLSV
jgi:hypothetical protein